MRCSIALLFALSFASLAADAVAQQDGGDGDRKAIETTASRWQGAWNGHDTAALAALVAGDADVITVAGTWLRSRKEFEEDHAKSHATVLRESVLTMKATEVRFIRPDVAVAHGEWGIRGVRDAGGTTRPPQQGVFTWVLEKRGGEWLITAAQNTIIRESTAK